MVHKATITTDDRLTYSRKHGLMHVCLVTSFIFHILALAIVNRALPIKWLMEPLRIYHVELIRPPVKDMDLEKDSQGLARLKETESKPVIQGEDTISLDTTDKRYVSYARVIKEALMAQWRYPAEAKENLIEGETFLVFTLSRDGTLRALRLISSSGYKVLDDEAMRTVRSAAPFPAFPGSVSVARLHIKANFDYRLSGRAESRTQ